MPVCDGVRLITRVLECQSLFAIGKQDCAFLAQISFGINDNTITYSPLASHYINHYWAVIIVLEQISCFFRVLSRHFLLLCTPELLCCAG